MPILLVLLVLLLGSPVLAESFSDDEMQSVFQTQELSQLPEALSHSEYSPSGEAPAFDPTKHSFAQQTAEALLPVVAETGITFPLIAMTIDRQAQGSGKQSSLIKGFFAALVGEIPRSGLMMSYNQIVSSPDDTLSDQFMIGLGSGILSGLTAAPIELVVTKQRFGNLSAQQVINNTLERRGVFGFRQGIVATVFRQSLANIAFWGVQPALLGALPASFSEENETVALVVSTAAAGAVGAATAMPFDVARGYIQRLDLKPGDRIPGTSEVLQKILKEEGTPGLWRGYTTRAAQYALAFNILRLAHEYIIDYNTEQNIKEYAAKNPGYLASLEQAQQHSEGPISDDGGVPPVGDSVMPNFRMSTEAQPLFMRSGNRIYYKGREFAQM